MTIMQKKKKLPGKKKATETENRIELEKPGPSTSLVQSISDWIGLKAKKKLEEV